MKSNFSILSFLTALFIITSCVDDDFEDMNHSVNYNNKIYLSSAIDKNLIK